jgi:hypothetical protein
LSRVEQTSREDAEAGIAIEKMKNIDILCCVKRILSIYIQSSQSQSSIQENKTSRSAPVDLD